MNATLWNRAALAIVVIVLATGGPWLARQLESLPRSAVAGRSEQRIVTLVADTTLITAVQLAGPGFLAAVESR
jgi:hypothetical protein